MVYTPRDKDCTCACVVYMHASLVFVRLCANEYYLPLSFCYFISDTLPTSHIYWSSRFPISTVFWVVVSFTYTMSFDRPITPHYLKCLVAYQCPCNFCESPEHETRSCDLSEKPLCFRRENQNHALGECDKNIRPGNTRLDKEPTQFDEAPVQRDAWNARFRAMFETLKAHRAHAGRPPCPVRTLRPEYQLMGRP